MFGNVPEIVECRRIVGFQGFVVSSGTRQIDKKNGRDGPPYVSIIQALYRVLGILINTGVIVFVGTSNLNFEHTQTAAVEVSFLRDNCV